MDLKELGTSEAIINKVSTTIDGGARIYIDLPPQSHDLITNLLKNKLENEKTIFLTVFEND